MSVKLSEDFIEDAEAAAAPSAPDNLKRSSLYGKCLQFANSPARSVNAGMSLGEAEIAYMPPGKQFTVFSMKDDKPVSEVFLTVDHTWLKGPLIWTDQLRDLDPDEHMFCDFKDEAMNIGSAERTEGVIPFVLLSMLCVISLFAALQGVDYWEYSVPALAAMCMTVGIYLYTYTLVRAANIAGFKRAAGLFKNPLVERRTFNAVVI